MVTSNSSSYRVLSFGLLPEAEVVLQVLAGPLFLIPLWLVRDLFSVGTLLDSISRLPD